MGNTVNDVKKSLKDLISKGYLLLYSLAYESQDADGKTQAQIEFKKNNIAISKLPNFNNEYESWYSEAILAIKIFLPDRLSDFIQLYKNDKRKKTDAQTYTISDALIGLRVTRGYSNPVTPFAATAKLKQQIAILEGAEKVIESVLNSLKFDIRADLFDSELDVVEELIKSGFYRAGGAMCGVILEKHFAQVCIQHRITMKKKTPTINDYNEELKNNNIIDQPTWRHIQLLGDLRNKCCHDKKVEPTKGEADDLLAGTKKIIKIVF